MNEDLPFRLALFAVLAAFVIHRGYYTKKGSRAINDTLQAREKDRVQTLATWFILAAMMLTAVYLVAPRLLVAFGLPLPAWLRWAGLGLALGGFALLQWAHAALGRNWSDRPRLLANQSLITSGPYRSVRHPIYTAFLLILSAPLLLSANWLVGLPWMAATVLEVVGRVRYEEALLAQTFPADYHLYAAATGRLLPRLRGKMEE
jgi:protein-S-isoprenylcysteine O-methyltransferase Ste14